MKYQYDRSFKFKLNEDTWEAYIITDEEANELHEDVFGHEDGFEALTMSGKNCLFVVEGELTKDLITHELIHMYAKYFFAESASITVDQYEEIWAEFFQANFDKFARKRTALYNKFKKLEDKYK